jgi:ABC-type uncharacterized transport system YnjBCD substrate-binding protein
MEIKNKYNCAPKIWAKFSEVEQKLWNYWFESINNVNLYPKGVTKEMTEVTAHNIACLIVWDLPDSFARCLSKKPHIVGKGSR